MVEGQLMRKLSGGRDAREGRMTLTELENRTKLRAGSCLTRACSRRAGVGAKLRAATTHRERAVEHRFVRGPAR
jgi:hypothetical protein